MFNIVKKKVKDLLRLEMNIIKRSLLLNISHQLKVDRQDEKELQGKIAVNILKSRVNEIKDIQEAEFKVFSQWGDDGIIQLLINKVKIEKKVFIEFGVENYQESNTRFLLQNNNWSGFVLDGSDENINFIKKSNFYWKYDLKCKSAFITKDNINDLIRESGIVGEIGILSIDIDGNDFWVWKNIDIVNPDIVIIEYNSVFGKERSITVPYDPGFIRSEAHYSNLYAGCSLSALFRLGKEKGYAFVGSNSAGNNAYFVKEEKAQNLKVLSVTEGYVSSKFRESRNAKGELTFIAQENRLDVIKGLPVYNTVTKETELI